MAGMSLEEWKRYRRNHSPTDVQVRAVPDFRALGVGCPTCWVEAGDGCVRVNGKRDVPLNDGRIHIDRRNRAYWKNLEGKDDERDNGEGKGQ